jgi:hypothetical protein
VHGATLREPVAEVFVRESSADVLDPDHAILAIALKVRAGLFDPLLQSVQVR